MVAATANLTREQMLDRIVAEHANLGQALAENGRVLATLDDWRAIVYVLVGVLIILVIIIGTLLRSTRQERRDMAAEREKIWTVADRFGAAAAALTVEMRVQAALSARVESALSHCVTDAKP